jgi:hypothetical protein
MASLRPVLWKVRLWFIDASFLVISKELAWEKH